MKRLSFIIKKQSLLEYWAILWFVLFSGSLYFQVLRIRPTMIIVGLSIIIFIFSGWKIRKTNFNLFVIYLVFMMFNVAFTFDNGVSGNDIILLILRFALLIMIQSNMTEENYQRKYVDIMVVEAIISLACFLYTDVLAIGELPLYGVEYGSANGYLLTPYYTVGWTNVGVFGRNAGLFLEPGSHQIFLNFALLFLLCSRDNLGYSRKRYFFSIIILIITVLTTQSTTGYMCLAMIMIAMIFMKRYGRAEDEGQERVNKYGWLKVTACIVMVILLLVENSTHVIESKFAGMYTGQSSAATRYNDTIVGYTIALSRPIFGYGFFNTTTTEVLKKYGVVNISNGLANFLIGSGLLLGISFLIWIFIRMKKSLPYGMVFNILVFAFYLMCINSEGGVLARLVYMTFLFEWEPVKSTAKELSILGGGNME